MQTQYSKIYILIKEDVDIGHALLACAHGSMMCYLRFGDTPEFKEYLDNSFRKCVCKVSNKEFEYARKNFDEFVIVTESALGNAETALVFKPRIEWPKAFQFYRLWKDNFKPDKEKYVKFDTSNLTKQPDYEAAKILEDNLWNTV